MAVVTTPPVHARRAGQWLFCLALTVYTATAGGSMTTTDAVVAFDLTRQLVEHRSVALSGNLLDMDAHRGADGRYYSPFGLAQSIYNVPFYLAGKAMTSAAPVRIGKPDSLLKAAVALGQAPLVAALAWLIFSMAMLVATPRVALTASLTCAFGSVLWPYSSFGFGQPLAAVTLMAAVLWAVRGAREGQDRLLVVSGVSLGLSLLSRHEMALAAMPIGLWILLDGDHGWPRRLRRLAAFAPGLAAGALTWFVYNAVRFGNPLDSGFLRDTVPGFGSAISSGLAGLLFSPSTSIFLYSPFAVLGVVGLVVLVGRDRSVGALLAALCLGALVFYATLGNWMAGRSYGSRYLLVVLPFLGVGWAVLLDRVRTGIRRPLFVAVTALGLAVQLPGVLVDYAKASQAAAARHPEWGTRQRQWSWDASGLVLNTAALVEAGPANVAYVTGRRAHPPVTPAASSGDRSFSQQFAFSLDLWWLYLHYLGVVSRTGVLAIVAAFAVTIALCAGRLCRAARRLGTGDGQRPSRWDQAGPKRSGTSSAS